MEAKKINEGVVTSIADTDLIFAMDPGGTAPKPISLTNLAKLIRESLQIGGRNHVLGSKQINLTNSVWGVALASQLAEPLIAGETYFASFGEKSDGLAGNIYLSEEPNTSKSPQNQTTPFNRSFIANRAYKYIWVWVVGNVDGDISEWIKNLKLERGNVATDWTPAPEDLG